MDQLIELLQQIQDLAGAGIDALKGAAEGAPPEGGPDGGKPEGGKPAGPPEGGPDGGKPEDSGDQPPEGEPR